MEAVTYKRSIRVEGDAEVLVSFCHFVLGFEILLEKYEKLYISQKLFHVVSHMLTSTTNNGMKVFLLHKTIVLYSSKL